MNPLGTGDPVQLGPYRLLGVLGDSTPGPAGGTDRVYFGRDDFGGTAAIRLTSPALTEDRSYAEHVLREAELAQAVTGPGVARVLEAGLAGERPWVAAEFLAGPTLTQAVEAFGPLPEPAVRALAVSLARTLEDIHAADLVHYALTPSAVILTSQGPRIVGFGVARPDRDLAITATGGPPATPGYAAPELILGLPSDAPADVFSLGAILAYAASGRHAFGIDGGEPVPAVLHDVVYEEPQLSDVSPDLRVLLSPCLSKEPSTRPTPAQLEESASPPPGAESTWLQGELADHITHRERTDHQPSTAISAVNARQGRGMTRRRALTTLAVTGAVTAAGGGAAWWWYEGREPDLFALPPAAETPKARTRTMPDIGAADGPTITPLWGPLKLVSEDTPPPLAVRDVIVFGAKNGGIAAHRVTDGKRRWTARNAAITAGYLSLSDALIATADERGTLRTYVAATGIPRWTAPRAEARTLLAADDEAVYVITKQGRLRSVSRSNARVRWTVRIPADLRTERPPQGVAAHGRLVVTTAAGDVFAVDTANGRQVWDLTDQSSKDMTIRPALANDTVFLNGRTLTARRISDGKELWTLPGGRAPATAINPGTPVIWGAPTVHENAVYATQGIETTALDLRDGTQVWSCSASESSGSPVLVQGRGAWYFEPDSLNEGGRLGLVRAANLKGGVVAPRWHFNLKNKGKHWLTAAGNRVFALDGEELTALPVF